MSASICQIFMSIYSVLGAVPGTEDTCLNNKDKKSCCPLTTYIIMRDMNNKQIKNRMQNRGIDSCKH